MRIDFANLQYQYQLYKSDIDARIQSVLGKSNYIMGEEITELEQQLSAFTGVKTCYFLFKWNRCVANCYDGD